MLRFSNYFSNNFLSLLVWILLINLFLLNNARAAYVLNNDAGTYTDDFANNTGVPTRSYVNVNTATGVLQLTSAASQTTFTAPYASSGNAITRVIKPVLIAEWGTLTINATIPAGTTLRAQITDDLNNPFTDDVIPGNFSQGIDLSQTTEIDLSSITVLYCAIAPNLDWGTETSCDKITSVKIKFIMTTTDTAVTPSITNISMDWARTQGEFASAEISSDDPWPTDYGDQQRTLSTSYYNSATYPAFKWISERHSGDIFYPNLYVLRDKILGYVNNSEGRLFSLDRDTGEEFWKIPGIYVVNAPGVVSENGTLYGHNMNVDYATSVNSNNGEVNWVYNWMGGHGGGLIVGDSGKIYYARDEANSTNATLVEQNPDGSIASQTVLNVVPEGFSSENKNVSPMTLGIDNIAYFITDTYSTVTYNRTEKGRLFAVNLETKEIEWSYPGNFESTMMVDSEGTVYVFSARIQSGEVTAKKVLAINSDGTLKWERNGGSDTGSGYYPYTATLRKDGKIMVYRTIDYDTYASVIEVIDSNDGSLVETLQNENVPIFSDGLNGYYHYNNYADPAEGSSYSYNAELNYSDSENNLKWKAVYPYSVDDGVNKTWYNFSNLAPDERGWLYGGFIKDTETSEYLRIREESFAKTYALAPWTLSDNSNISGEKKPGDVLNFNVSSSMLLENPLLGGENKMQVLMSNGDKIPLSFESIDSDRNTTWNGTYTIPQDFPEGSVTYTIEASQSYLQTDIPTHFDQAPTESNNTGIIIAQGFINDATLPTNKTGNISLKFGNNKLDLKKNSNHYLNEKSFKLAGKNEEAKNGQIKISKKNSKGSKDLITTISIDENGNWNYKSKKEKDGKMTYYLQTIDSAGNEGSINSFKVIRDTHDPFFKEFPKAGIYKKGTKLSFQAKDKDTDIDFYKVKLYPKKGSWTNLKGNEYIIPSSITSGNYVLAVKVYDKAGNSTTKQIPIVVR